MIVHAIHDEELSLRINRRCYDLQRARIFQGMFAPFVLACPEARLKEKASPRDRVFVDSENLIHHAFEAEPLFNNLSMSSRPFPKIFLGLRKTFN
jgi:hypothetical protein